MALHRQGNFGFILKRVTRLLRKRFEAHAQELALTLEECQVLFYLNQNEGISQAALSELTDIEPMTLVRILDRMEDEGWTERRPHRTDRRARQLYLRTRAKNAVEQIHRVGEKTITDAMIGFSPDEREALMSLLERAYSNLARLDVSMSQTTVASRRPRS
jgi:DNA-binding MarR family transcriptional regulator